MESGPSNASCHHRRFGRKPIARSIGIEYMYMREPEQLQWFKNAIELKNRPHYDKETKREIYRKLAITTGF